MSKFLDNLDTLNRIIKDLRAELAAERERKDPIFLWAEIRKQNAARKAAEAERDALRVQVAEKDSALEKMDDDARWTISDVEHDLTDMRLRAEHAESERDALRAQLAEAGKALKPFAVALTRAVKVYGATAEDGWSVANTTAAQIITYGDLRRARAVYEKIKESD